VVVEGHTIGRLDGFRFAPDTTAGTSDAKALSAAAQKALSGEIEARANKLAHAPDAQFVLTSDATIRWIGDPVAKIIAGDVVLRPRVRILADEQLTGAALEAVQTRLDLWLRTHVERLLGPLFLLSAAEEITGLARGIAYQIVETLGVLERSKVADDLKSLDQASRAVLRKHGVRFGAYHVYVPALLKPAPRSLAAQLWALQHGGPEMKGLDDLQRLASSGRTSFPADKEIQRPLYRTIGYRVCAERAVRVDILERLADLIRPALAWRPNSSGSKPAGAFEGIGFTVTQAMTSLTGSSGEDFASILRALGYRMEKRPKPPEPATPPAVEATSDAVAAATVDAPSPSSEAAGDPAAEGGQDAVAHEAPAEVSAEESAAPVSGQPTSDGIEAATDSAPGAMAQEPPAIVPSEAVEAQAAVETGMPPAESAIEAGACGATSESAPAAESESAASEAPAQAADSESAVAEAPASAAEAPGEPELVEVWRPGGRGEERRGPRRPARRAHRSDRPAQVADGAATPAAATEAPAVAAEAGTEPEKPHHRRRRRGPPGEFRRDRGDQPEARDQGERRPESRGERRSGDRPPAFAKDHRRDHRQDHRQDHRHDQKDRHDYKDRREPPQRREREKQPDPNSPFAKLAALKAQLEANAKERH